jgi:hypothetical protein
MTAFLDLSLSIISKRAALWAPKLMGRANRYAGPR